MNAIPPQAADLPDWLVGELRSDHAGETGALPALARSRAVYATIDAVETFVDHHYRQQIERLDHEGVLPGIRALLERCREEEVHHRDEARGAATAPPGVMLRAWAVMVGAGSSAAVAAARRV